MSVARRAAAALGSAVADARAVPGGDVNQALHLRLLDGREVFVKHRADAPPGMYAAERSGLLSLAAAPGAPRVPVPLAATDGFLALEWIAAGRPGPGHDEALGRGLAALHAAGGPTFGFGADNWIGTIPQPNAPLPAWPAFYRDRRLGPLTRVGRDRGLLTAAAAGTLDRVLGRLDDLCGPPEPPALLHGDLWGGNAMTDSAGAPVLVDPAVYHGHREVDLAMMRLFEGFSARVFAAYAEARPLAPGHEDRVDLYQLYPLLMHLVLFGDAYAGRVARAAARYA